MGSPVRRLPTPITRCRDQPRNRYAGTGDGRGTGQTLDTKRLTLMTGCSIRRAGRYSVHADVICLMAGNSAGSGTRRDLPRSAGSRVLPDRFKISQLTAGLSWAPYRATGELHRRHASGPHQWPPEPRSVHRCGHQPDPPPDIRPEIHPIRGGSGQRPSVYSLRSSCTRLV